MTDSLLHFNNKCWDLNLYELHRVPQKLLDDENYVAISSQTLNTELRCPICLDMLKNTMTTKECLHRFCQECIITALRSGNKECPTCRKKLVSKRSLRRDPNFDELITKLYPYREQTEFTNHDNWLKVTNKTIQDLSLKSSDTSQQNGDANEQNSQIEIIFRPRDGCPLSPRFLKTTANATIEHLSKYLSMRASAIPNSSSNVSLSKFDIFYLKDGQYTNIDRKFDLYQVYHILSQNPLNLYFKDIP